MWALMKVTPTNPFTPDKSNCLLIFLPSLDFNTISVMDATDAKRKLIIQFFRRKRKRTTAIVIAFYATAIKKGNKASSYLRL